MKSLSSHEWDVAVADGAQERAQKSSAKYADGAPSGGV
jgi:hypothetical protein